MKKTIKSDLFRFATLRNPQLLSEEDKQLGFVFHPDLEQSSMYNSIVSTDPANATERTTALKEFAAEQTGLMSKKDEVKQVSSSLYNLAQWISRNRHRRYTEDEVRAKTAGLQVLTLTEKLTLWKNLFYQTVTSKSSAIREALIQMLVADHFLAFVVEMPDSAVDQNFNQFTILANAKVVIPKEIVPGKVLSESAKSNFIDYAQVQKEKDEVVKLSELQMYDLAVKEILSLKRHHESKTAEELKAAYKTYQESIKDLIDDAASQADPVTGKVTVDPVFPEFDYSGFSALKSLVEDHDLSTNTSRVLKLVVKNDYMTIDEVVKEIEARMSDLNRNFSRKSRLPSRKVLFRDAVSFETNFERDLPVGNSLENLYDYNFCSAGDESFNLIINAGYSMPEIVSAEFTVTDSLDFYTTGTAVKNDGQHVTGYLIRIHLVPQSTAWESDVVRVRGTVLFSNGNTVSFDSTVGTKACVKGIAKLVTATTDEPQQALIGIHQIGIADYRKVEQEICCYLPGEVSHIENILKGEYKERATRRLKRSETTIETSVERETENLTDTSSTDRNEMHNETSKVLAEDRSVSASASVNGKFGPVSFSAGAGYASNTSQTDSDATAVSYAQDVTTRAMERVVQKISDKRTQKMIDEYEENNKHGFDNRGKTAQNISGVYRWVDKVYKNQLVNYGKRLMYEMMVPEPARFLTSVIDNNNVKDLQVLDKPIDPRTYINSASMINAGNYQYYASLYNAAVAAPPSSVRSTGHSFSVAISDDSTGMMVKSDAVNVKLPEGYYTTNAKAQMSGQPFGNYNKGKGFSVGVGNAVINHINTNTWEYNHSSFPAMLDSFVDEIPVSMFFCNFYTGQITVSINLQVLPEFVAKWQNETFEAILSAYEDKLKVYNDAVAEIKSENSTNTTTISYNPLQSRMIEMGELKKNCLQLLLSPYGRQMGVNTLSPDGTININAAFGNHAETVRFFEAAFEWEIMSYIFYPYFWADKSKWENLVSQDNNDPLFKAFLQAGMSKVVLSVRPGFEEAVLYYLQTGKVWDGKDIAIDDELYLSILAEQLPVESVPEGEPWETRLPTSLTVLQKDSVSVIEQGLPCSCIDEDNGENNGFESVPFDIVPAEVNP